jgi:hypothetical protein
MADILEQKEELNKDIDPVLEQKVSDSLALIPDEVADADDGDEDVEEKGDVSTNDSDAGSGDDNGNDTDSTISGNKEEEVVLPENFRRAAIHQGWSEDEVSEFFKSNPEQATKTFEKIYNSTNYITEQTAALGRIAQQEQQKRLAAETKPQKPKFREIVDALKKKYGEEDPGLVDMLEVITQQNEELYNTVTSLKGQEQPKLSDNDGKIWDTINGFFNASNISVYEPFYGKTGTDGQWGRTLTGEQNQNRMKVLEKADQIVAGAQLQGKEVKYEDAMLQAHLVISDKVRENVMRQDLVQKVKARNNGLTVKGVGTKTVEQPDAPKSDEKAVKNASKGLKKLFRM